MDARAYRIPYPPPARPPNIYPPSIRLADYCPPSTTAPDYDERRAFIQYGKTVDFPDRGISYVLICDQAHVEQCIQEVLKTIAAHAHGSEPARLEIRFTASPWNASA